MYRINVELSDFGRYVPRRAAINAAIFSRSTLSRHWPDTTLIDVARTSFAQEVSDLIKAMSENWLLTCILFLSGRIPESQHDWHDFSRRYYILGWTGAHRTYAHARKLRETPTFVPFAL